MKALKIMIKKTKKRFDLVFQIIIIRFLLKYLLIFMIKWIKGFNSNYYIIDFIYLLYQRSPTQNLNKKKNPTIIDFSFRYFSNLA